MHWLGKATYCNWHYKSIVLADTFLNSNIKRIMGVDGNILHLLFDSVNDFRKKHEYYYARMKICLCFNNRFFTFGKWILFWVCSLYYSDVHMSYSEPLCFSHFLCTIINLISSASGITKSIQSSFPTLNSWIIGTSG